MSDMPCLTSLDPNVIYTAKCQLERQPDIPKSPAIFHEDGTKELCLAAALAQAGLATQEPDSSESFVTQLQRDSRSVFQIDLAFERMGWGADLSRKVRELNDSFPDSTRKQSVLELLYQITQDDAQPDWEQVDNLS
tara:strand:- start:97659 stop:98066 length:408 start_codon:yes stop_codon:yes gene_type:complete